MPDLDQSVKDDLDQLRNGGGNGGATDGGKSGQASRQVGAGDVPDLGLGGEGGNAPKWVKYGIYAALIIAIIQMYVGIPVPDSTLLVLVGLGFLVLGLWAGMRMHEELAQLAERFNKWRQS